MYTQGEGRYEMVNRRVNDVDGGKRRNIFS
jgi:hypothetical protein